MSNKSILKSSRGAFLVPMIAVLAVMTVMGLGVSQLWSRWKDKVLIQTELDSCVERGAAHLKRTLQELQKLNGIMERTRQAAMLASTNPSALAAMRTLLIALYSRQEFLKWKWEAERIRWLMSGSIACKKAGVVSPLPKIPWSRFPQDHVGPHPLVWTGSVPNEFFIYLKFKNRSSGARVFVDGGVSGRGMWKAEWSLSQKRLFSVWK